jgi:lipoprotein-releasing system permease protein
MGAVIGIIAGVALTLAQQHFGLISMGGAGEFIVESYPVEIVPGDVAATFITVIVVGFITVWLPVKALTRKYV